MVEELFDNLINELKENADPEQAEKMSAYMKNRFKFLGIPKPKLKTIIRPYLSETGKEMLDWNTVTFLWNMDFREAQYVALEYIGKHKKQLVPEDIDRLKYLIVNRSWWETVDTIDAFVGRIVLKDESLKSIMLEWSVDENIWLRRTAIDFQQEYKEKTDTEILEKIILANLNSNEFFINKAIGWSLRDYSKTDSEWVRSFVDEHKEEMASLSIKEAVRLL